MVSNRFFAPVVRIQRDRGHTVATAGPYRIVRHPGYVGMVVCGIAVPLMLGSLWALILAVVGVGVAVLRTALEDRTLQNELEGYREYASRVRYRLIPGVW
jgi:protein-S-isoprenylcysteine O-methyltransferase Ste14